MAKTKVQKEVMVSGMADRLGRMLGAVFADFAGLKVRELEELRVNARAAGCEYFVVKKTLFKVAAKERGIPTDVADAAGNLSILFGFTDHVAAARIAKQFAKAHAGLKVLGGLLREGLGIRSLAAKEAVALGDLPSIDELRARLVGSIASPLRGLVGVMQGNVRSIVSVLSAIQKAKSN